MTTLHWHDSSQERKSLAGSAWFAISMGLLGLITGYFIGTVF